MKFFIFSIVLHILIFIFGFSLDMNRRFEVDNIGNDFSSPSISVSFNSVQTSLEKESEESALEDEQQENTMEEKIDEKVEEVIEEKIEVKAQEPEIKEKKMEVIKKEEKKPVKPKKVLEKKKTEPNKTVKQPQNNSSAPSDNSDLIELSHGVFAAKNQGVQGLKYSFIQQPDPEYPLAAKRISYNKEVSIKVRFLVGLNGKIEEIKFYNEKDSLGFQKEVEKTLNKWRLTPVTLNNKTIKLYFYKEFKFNQK